MNWLKPWKNDKNGWINPWKNDKKQIWGIFHEQTFDFVDISPERYILNEK